MINYKKNEHILLYMVERISTGISGFDELIDGGVPKGFAILLSGAAGCGKTIFSSQFLWEGAKNGENCLYLTFEERPDSIKSDVEHFGWDFDNENIDISYENPVGGRRFSERVMNHIEEKNIDRLVLDPISILLGSYENDPSKMRETFFRLVDSVRDSNATTFFISEVPQYDEEKVSRYGIEEFVVDGVFVLYYTGMGESSFRNLEVKKIRQTAHEPGTYPFKIKSGKGIEVQKQRL